MKGRELRTARVSAGITGETLCRKAEINRNYLSEIERGARIPTPEQSARISAALEALVAARRRIDEVAMQVGWPSAHVGV